MDNGSQLSMTLMRMPEGGYLVTDAYRLDDDRGRFHSFHFASTTIDEALKFMCDKIKPDDAESPPQPR